MNSAIQEIYERKTVTGKSGRVFELRSAISSDKGKFLSNIIAQDPTIKKTLEVGCAVGMSSLHICLSLRGRSGALHTIIDPNQTTQWDNAGIKNLEAEKINFFNLIEEKSEFALPDLLKDKEASWDLVFIDGFHTFDHTLIDAFYATRLLRVGGYLVIDDTNWPSVNRVYKFLKSYPCYELHGFVAPSTSFDWKRRLIKKILSPVPDRLLKYLPNKIYERLRNGLLPSMIALKKIGPDQRSWTWHCDKFCN